MDQITLIILFINLIFLKKIKKEFWADLVIFDPNTIIDNATWKDPHQYPTGISWVIVNGDISIDHRIWTEKLSGKVLIHTP